MIALADQSTMPLWPWWAWLLLAAALVAFSLRRRRADKPADLDAPINLYPVCPTRGCRYPARRPVESFTGRIVVCHGCADEGIAHGWFTAA